MLEKCRATIEARDTVLDAAKVGMGHWSDHIQAQTDLNAGKISVQEMEDIFDRTKTAGDEDEKAYNEAVNKLEKSDGSCDKPDGVSTAMAERFDACVRRGRAQESVLAAAHDGMSDWMAHLKDMRKADKGKIHNPQQRWLRTWRAAPKNIRAYDKAVDQFQAPDCR